MSSGSPQSKRLGIWRINTENICLTGCQLLVLLQSEIRLLITAYTPAELEFPRLKPRAELLSSLELALDPQGGAEPLGAGMWLCRGWPPP